MRVLGAGGEPPRNAPPGVAELLAEAEGSVAPAVSAVVWRAGKELYARGADRVYDLASLTKPLCTAELALRAVSAGALALDAGHPRLPDGVTVRHLLTHTSGWPAWRPLWEEGDRAAIVRAALATPPAHPPGAVHTYSDIGFLALGAVVEDVGGARLDALLAPHVPLRWGDPRAEPTYCLERREIVRGTVHDRNAAAMGGVAPHAGLFGSAREVAACAARWLDGAVPLAARAFVERGVGSHALGWDTAATDGTSSAGPRPPAGLAGHLGFTGTALWIAPAAGLVAVLLTNRTMNGPDLAGIKALRRAWFQAVWDGFCADAPAGRGG